MKTFYSAQDIEEMAGQGVRELVVDADTVLTSVARDAAARLGVKLVSPGQRAVSGSTAPVAPAVSPSKPRGCQHPPIGSGQVSTAASPRGTGSSTVVDDLIGAVKQLTRRD